MTAIRLDDWKTSNLFPAVISTENGESQKNEEIFTKHFTVNFK